MPRETKTQTKKNKIRKRGYSFSVSSSSASSASSMLRNHRFKKAILVGSRAGSTTPVPEWKFMTSKSPVSEGLNLKSKGHLSARKLAATLWEMDGDGDQLPEKEKEKGEVEGQWLDPRGGRVFEVGFSDDFGRTQQQHFESGVGRNKGDGLKIGGQRRRSLINSRKKIQLAEDDGDGSFANDYMIESTSYPAVGNMETVKTRLKDVKNSLTASKELVKVLCRMLSEEEQHSWRLTLVSALKVELDRSKLQIDQVIQEHRFNHHHEVYGLLKRFEEEKAARKSREQERIDEVLRELDIEKRMRRQAERLNKKLGSELANARAELSKATKELDHERRTRELLEQTCNELAVGIGEDREEVEELKRESAKEREEVEKEREMLQLADVLREERVQMKLAEARYEFEEKTAALERLRSELEEGHFGHSGIIENGHGSPYLEPNREYAEFLKKILDSRQNGYRERYEAEHEGEVEESGDSERHSIELNMDNKNKIYKWGFAPDNGSTQGGESRRPSVEEMFKGRKSLCEKIQWENICLYKKGSDSEPKPKPSAVCPEEESIVVDDGVKRSGKSLRDHMYPSSRTASRQASLSPTKDSFVAGGSRSNSLRY